MKAAGADFRRTALSYASAVAAVLVTVIVRWLLAPVLGDKAVGIFYVPAVMLAAWQGGLGPGLAATALGGLSMAMFFMPPLLSLKLHDPADTLRLGVFCGVGVFVSVTAQQLRSTADALRRAGAESRDVVESITDAFASLDRDWRFLYLNERAALLAGGDREALLGKVIWEEFPAVVGTPFHAGLVRAMEQRVPVHLDPAPGEGGRWFETRAYPSEAGISVFAAEITEQKRTEIARRQLAAIVESSEDAIIGKDLNGILTSWNEGAERLYGYKAAEALGRSISFLVPPGHPDDVPAILERVRRGERVEQYETVRVTKDGRRVDVSLTVSPVRDDNGAIIGAAKIARDVTRRKRLERELQDRSEQIETQLEELQAQREELQLQNEELAEQDRYRNQFLAMLAHELRNPLAPIIAAAEVLRVRGQDPQADRQLGVIARQARHLARLVDDLLDVSRLTRGAIALRKEPIELAAIVDQSLQVCEPLIRERRHELKVSLPPGPVRVEADPTRMVQVVCNLLNNAAKYTEPGGQIELSVQVEAPGGPLPPDPGSTGAAAVVRVRDNGRGIDPALLPRVFDVFVQAERAADRSEGGLGVGLTLVRSLVEQHGGTVEALSGGLGRGSEFVVRLPLAGHAPEAADDPAAGASGPAGAGPAEPRRVLIVEDSRETADALAELATVLGYRAVVAYNGADGLAEARRLHPDVVLLDIGMPDMDGWELARRLRSDPETSSSHLVALTGYGTEDDRLRSRQAGIDRHLVKPIDAASLERVLQGLRP